jgi:hypothetical protein
MTTSVAASTLTFVLHFAARDKIPVCPHCGGTMRRVEVVSEASKFSGEAPSDADGAAPFRPLDLR